MLSIKQHLFFVHQLKNTIISGIPIIRALDIMQENPPARALKRALPKIKSDITGGLSLADAMKKHPRTFDRIILSTIQAAEKSGQLEEMLQKIEDYYERIRDMQRKFRNAMIMPCINGAFLLGFIVIFPMIIKFVMENHSSGSINDLAYYPILVTIRTFTLTLLGGIAASIFASKFLAWLFPASKKIGDRFILFIPIVGGALRKFAIFRIIMTFSNMIQGGMTIEECILRAGESASNSYLERRFKTALRSIREGKSIAESMRSTKLFPNSILEAFALGEQSGKLDTSLRHTATELLEGAFTKLHLFTKLMPIILLLIFAVVVTVLLYYIYFLPIKEVMDSL